MPDKFKKLLDENNLMVITEVKDDSQNMYVCPKQSTEEIVRKLKNEIEKIKAKKPRPYHEIYYSLSLEDVLGCVKLEEDVIIDSSYNQVVINKELSIHSKKKAHYIDLERI